MTHARRGAAAALAAALLGVLVVAAPSADAASYRYWTYWWGQPGSTSWTFAQLGPASDRPKDGSVIGWRFAVTTESGGRKPPRAGLPFSDLCPGLAEAPSGSKRVAVVVDYGTTSDAPPGQSPPGGGTVRVECVTVASTANGVAVLNAADVTVRWGSDGLVCALDGYPKNECAAIVADPTPTPTRTKSPSPKPSSSTRPTTTAGATTASSSSTAPRSAAATATGTPSSTAGGTTAPASTGPGTPSSTGSEAPLPISSGAPAAAPGDDAGGGSPVGALVGILVVAALGAGAWWTARARSS